MSCIMCSTLRLKSGCVSPWSCFLCTYLTGASSAARCINHHLSDRRQRRNERHFQCESSRFSVSPRFRVSLRALLYLFTDAAIIYSVLLVFFPPKPRKKSIWCSLMRPIFLSLVVGKPWRVCLFRMSAPPLIFLEHHLSLELQPSGSFRIGGHQLQSFIFFVKKSSNNCLLCG